MTARSDIGYCVELTGADLALLWEYVNHTGTEQVEIATDITERQGFILDGMRAAREIARAGEQP